MIDREDMPAIALRSGQLGDHHAGVVEVRGAGAVQGYVRGTGRGQLDLDRAPHPLRTTSVDPDGTTVGVQQLAALVEVKHAVVGLSSTSALLEHLQLYPVRQR